MERCIKSLKDEVGSLAAYQDIDELYVGIASAISYYNTKRIHLALKTTPAAYAASLKSQQKSIFKRRGMVFGKKGA